MDKQKLDLFTLPFIAKYRALTFYGLADGATPLSFSFDIEDIKGRYIVIKSFKIYNYYNSDSVDLWLNDGATDTVEQIEEGYRIDRLFDRWGSSTDVSLKINNSPVGIFAQLASKSHYPADLDLDNIFYKYPEKVATIELVVFTQILRNLQTLTLDNPLIKVLMECYII